MVTNAIGVVARRLLTQHLAGVKLDTPLAVVSHFGAVQAQDYLGALWAVGLRMRDAVEADVERALAERSIVRLWPQRGTLHFVASEDARWIVDLLAPRVLARNRNRYKKEFDLDAVALRRCRTVVERALRDGAQLTRPEIYAALERARIATGASRGLHILVALAHERVLCFGPRRGKQPTFVLFDEWLPFAKPKPVDESLAELTLRYFTGHGPATIADFMWWSGLTAREVRQGLAGVGDALTREDALYFSPSNVPRVSATAHLLPPYDEYTVGFKDRSAVLDPAFAKNVNAGGGVIQPIVVLDGRVVGTWKRTLGPRAVQIHISAFRPLSARERASIDKTAARYAGFVGCSQAIVR